MATKSYVVFKPIEFLMDNRSIQWLQRELKMTCGNAESTTVARSVSSIIALSVKDELIIDTDESRFTVGKVDDVYRA